MSKRTKLLLKENNQKESEMKMKEDNMKILTDMIVYIRSANISPYYQEVVRRDIGQMMIDGERRGMNAQEVIGGSFNGYLVCLCGN